MLIKNCAYRNCEMPFYGRTTKKFCCIKCKRNELKYKQREQKAYIKERDLIYSLIDRFKKTDIDPIMVALYDKIYSK